MMTDLMLEQHKAIMCLADTAGTYEVNAEETQDELTKYALFHQADEARHLIVYIESWGVMQKITNRADKMKKNN